MSGLLRDTRVSAWIKRKVSKTVVRTVMMYGLETVARKKQSLLMLEVAEMKIFFWSDQYGSDKKLAQQRDNRG